MGGQRKVPVMPPCLNSKMDPGYELHTKLITDFPMPNDQYEIMRCVSRTANKADPDTSVPRCFHNPRRSRIKTCINTCPEAAQRGEWPSIRKSTRLTMDQTHPRKPVIIFSHGAWHVSAHYLLLEKELEGRGYTVVNNNHPSSNNKTPSKASIQDDFDQFRSTTLSYLTAGKDVVVVMHSFGGIVATHALVSLGPDEIESHPDKPRGRVLSLVYLCAFLPKFEGSLEDVQEVSPPKWLTIDPARGVACLVAEHVNECLYNDLTSDQQKWALSQTVPLPLSVFAGAQIGTTPRMPPYKTIPTTYIVCDEDKGVPTAGQEMMIARVKKELDVDLKQIHLNAGHSAFISMPGAVADIIEGSF